MLKGPLVVTPGQNEVRKLWLAVQEAEVTLMETLVLSIWVFLNMEFTD